MMMQAPAPAHLGSQAAPSASPNLMLSPALAHAHLAALSAPAHPPAHYNKAGRDTTWTKLFVGGLPYETTDKELREFFEEFGAIEEAVVIIDRVTQKSKGYGFVTMADHKAASKAVQNPNPVIQGRKSNVNFAFIGAKHNFSTPRATAEGTPYVMSSDAYTAAAAASMRYAAYLPQQFGAKGALRTKIVRGAAGVSSHRPLQGPYRASNTAPSSMVYASPYTQLQVQSPAPQLLPSAPAYPAPASYDYMVPSAAQQLQYYAPAYSQDPYALLGLQGAGGSMLQYSTMAAPATSVPSSTPAPTALPASAAPPALTAAASFPAALQDTR